MEGLHHSHVLLRAYHMGAESDPTDARFRPGQSVPQEGAIAPYAPTLLAARMWPTTHPLAVMSLVGDLDLALIRRLRDQALAMGLRHACSVVLELSYVDSPRAAALIAKLRALEAHDVRVIATPLAPRLPGTTADARGAHPGTTRTSDTPPAGVASAGDAFGLDPSFRALCLPPLRILFERYFRTEVTGLEHVPVSGPAVLAANHSGAFPIDAVMLAVALELRHPNHRCLRALYEQCADGLPWIPRLYSKLGGVPASFTNAELLLRTDQLVGMFPEGLAGAEKSWIQRYHLRPFRNGAARLSLRTGAPIVPVAIVGAEEAYPMIARSRLAGRALGLPWVPITPLFPILGLAGTLPLPSRWHIRFCPPIRPPALTTPDTAHSQARELTHRLRHSVDVALGEMLAHRRGAFL